MDFLFIFLFPFPRRFNVSLMASEQVSWLSFILLAAPSHP